MYQATSKSLLAVLLLLGTPACFAERADRSKPLRLVSDQVLIDDAKKISTFSGNVQLTQGTLLIKGDKIVVVQDKDGFKHGTAYGKPASFRQKHEGMDEYVDGIGERIEYDTRAEAIDFYVQASVRRGLNEVRGEHINYNVKTESFQVSNGGESTADTPPKRVRAVLQPKSKQVTETPGSLPDDSGKTPTPAE